MKNPPTLSPESFVTANEMARIRELESILDSISGHVELTRAETADQFKRKFSQARAAYVETPTPQNFDNCIELLLLRDRELLFVRDGRLRDVVEDAHKKLFHDKFLPLVSQIIERNLKHASANLTEITNQENERHTEMFGVPVADSTLIRAARQRLLEMKAFKDALGHELGISHMQELLVRLRRFGSS